MNGSNLHIPREVEPNDSYKRIFSKGARYTEKKKVVEHQNYNFTLNLPTGLERTHVFYSEYSNKPYRGQIVIGKDKIYVTLMERSSYRYNKLCYFNKQDGSYMGEIGLPAPDLYNFGIATREDRLFIIGGLVDSEPGYRKNFLLESRGRSRVNNNLSEGEVFRTFFDPATKSIAYRCNERVYVVNAETKKGAGFGLSKRRNNPDVGGCLGFRSNHLVVWDVNHDTQKLRIIPRLLENGRIVAPTERSTCEIPLSECRSPRHLSIAEDVRVVVSSDLGTFNVGLVDGKYQKTNNIASTEMGCCEEISDGTVAISVNNTEDYFLHCAYSGEHSELTWSYKHTYLQVEYGVLADLDFEEQEIRFYQLSNL